MKFNESIWVGLYHIPYMFLFDLSLYTCRLWYAWSSHFHQPTCFPSGAGNLSMSDPASFCLCLCLYLCLCHCVLSFVLCVFPNVGHLSLAAKPYSTQVGKKIGNIKERWKILFFFHRVPRQRIQSIYLLPIFSKLDLCTYKKVRKTSGWHNLWDFRAA